MTRYYSYWILLLVLLYCGGVLGQIKTRSGSEKNEKLTDKRTTIVGYFDDMQLGDSVTLRIWPGTISALYKDYTPYKEYSQVSRSGSFRLVIPRLKQPVYFSLLRTATSKRINFVMQEVLDSYILEPGDDIRIEVKKGHLSFHGARSEKLSAIHCLNELDSVLWTNTYTQPADTTIKPLMLQFTRSNVYGFNSMVKNINMCNAILSTELDSLNAIKEKLTKSVYSLIKSDLIEKNEINKIKLYLATQQEFRSVLKKYNLSGVDSNSITQELLNCGNFYKNKIQSFHFKSYRLDPNSQYFIDLLILNTEADCANSQRNISAEYDILKSQYNGDVLDKALTVYFLRNQTAGNLNPIVNRDDLIENAYYLVVKNENCRVILQSLLKEKIGDRAFMFHLTGINGKEYQMSDFIGRVVFMDFWFTGCDGCSSYYQNELSNAERYFEDDSSVLFLSISIDRDRDKWLKSVNENTYSSPTAKNVVNLYTGGRGLSSPIISHYKILAYPRPLVISKDGRIFEKNQVDLRDREKLIEIIEAALSF
jgi:hypothetical protein